MRRIIKTVLIVLGALFFLVLAAAIVIPLVVNVDKYRPQILAVANKNLNGKLDIGKLSLSLWGEFRVDVAGVTLTGARGEKILSVKEAFFHLPLGSVLKGSPILNFRMIKPDIAVVRDQSGDLNVMTLVKEKPIERTAPSQPVQPSVPAITDQPPPKRSEVTLPAIAQRASLGIALENSMVSYKDLVSGLQAGMKDLNLVIENLSLSKPMKLQIWSNLNTSLVKEKVQTLSIRGPAKITATGTPKIQDGRLVGISLLAKGNFDDVEIDMPGTFKKAKGTSAHFDTNLSSTEKEAIIEKFDLEFLNAVIHVNGRASKLGNAPVFKLTAKSNEIQLKPWADLLPALAEYKLGGIAIFDADFEGPSDNFNYKANLYLKNLSASSPALKATPVINGSVHVSTDRIDNLTMDLKAPSNDVQLVGSLTSFTVPKFNFRITSNQMDLDQLIVFPPPGRTSAPAPAAPNIPAQGPNKDAPPPVANGPVAKAEYDSSIVPLRTNKIFQNTTGVISASIKTLKAYDIKMTDIQTKMSLTDLIFNVEQFGMNIWNGSLKANASFNLKESKPAYKFSGNVASLDLKQAIASQMQFLKDTAVGKFFLKIDGSGRSFNPDLAIQNLSAKGNFRIDDAVFRTVDVMKMTADAINKAIGRVAEKVPPLKGKSLKNIANRESKYDQITSDVIVDNGKLLAPNFVAKARTNEGIDLSGRTEIGLSDKSIKASWQVSDTYNLTGARNIDIETGGAKIEHVLAEGNNPVRLPINVGCTISAPCYSYSEVPEYLAKVAVSNIAKGLSKGLSEKATEELRKKLPPKAQDAVKDIRKKLFGN